MAVWTRKVCPDVMVPNSKVTQIVDIFLLVCQTVKAVLHVYIFEILAWFELDFPNLHSVPEQRKYFLSKQPARFSVVSVRRSSDLPIKLDSTSGM